VFYINGKKYLQILVFYLIILNKKKYIYFC